MDSERTRLGVVLQEVKEGEGVPILILDGDVDLCTVTEDLGPYERRLIDNPPAELTVDLRKARFGDCTGLYFLARLINKEIKVNLVATPYHKSLFERIGWLHHFLVILHPAELCPA